MKIVLQRQYKSIASLTTEELPDFTVLIGRNGAGKTQLLEALQDGAATVFGIGLNDIELYHMSSFRPPGTGTANRNSNIFAKETADAYLLSGSADKAPIDTAATIFNEFAADIESNSGSEERESFELKLRDQVRDLGDFTIFANNRETPYSQAIFDQVLGPFAQDREGRRGQRPRNSFGGNRAILLTTAMKLCDKLPHELTRDDILRASHYEDSTLSNSISEVFATYKVEQFIWAHERVETELISFDELMEEYRKEHPAPWETLRGILSQMREAAGGDGLFDFVFSDPEGFKLTLSNYERFSFTAEMTNRTTGAQYDLESLSSGEKVLMALCLASFNQYLGRRSPKLLLLDELDAVLHPSMVAALVRTLKTLFLPKGTKVLMTSHAAMTMANLDEADIYRVVRKGDNVEICRTTKSQAINELSEGLATVDVGLRIAAYDGAKVTILTEGHNTKHLKRWVELNFPK